MPAWPCCSTSSGGPRVKSSSRPRVFVDYTSPPVACPHARRASGKAFRGGFEHGQDARASAAKNYGPHGSRSSVSACRGVEDWPCSAENFGREPDAFAYAAAARFPGIKYVRADACEKPAEATLESIKSFLAAGFALVFGFPVLTSVTAEADIPCATDLRQRARGRAAMAVGYDDRYRVRSWRRRVVDQSCLGRRVGRARLRLAAIHLRDRGAGGEFLDARFA